MPLSRQQLDEAVARDIISAAQRDGLLALGAESRAAPGTERAPAVMIAYAAGAAAVLFAFGWFLVERWRQLGAVGVLVVVLVYAAVFALTSRWLRREGFPLAAAFAALLAVGMTPVASWAIMSLTGFWHDPSFTAQGRHVPFADWLPTRWAVLELATALVALLVYRRIPFAPLAIPVAIAGWLAPLHMADAFHDRDIAGALFGWGSFATGSVLLIAALVVDQRAWRSAGPGASRRGMHADAAGWVYRVALVAYFAGIVSLFDDTAVVRHGLIVFALLGAGMALWLGRREMLAAGAAAFLAYLGYLAFDVFERVLSFPVVLATFGLGIILLTVLAQRRWPALMERLSSARRGEPRLPGGYAIPGALLVVALVLLALEPPRARERLDERQREAIREVRRWKAAERAQRAEDTERCARGDAGACTRLQGMAAAKRRAMETQPAPRP